MLDESAPVRLGNCIYRLVGAVSNCAYAVRSDKSRPGLETAPTGGESVHLFLELTIAAERDQET